MPRSTAEAIEAQGWTQEGMPTNALLISRPSKSADIAQVLALWGAWAKVVGGDGGSVII